MTSHNKEYYKVIGKLNKRREHKVTNSTSFELRGPLKSIKYLSDEENDFRHERGGEFSDILKGYIYELIDPEKMEGGDDIQKIGKTFHKAVKKLLGAKDWIMSDKDLEKIDYLREYLYEDERHVQEIAETIGIDIATIEIGAKTKNFNSVLGGAVAYIANVEKAKNNY